ncbi:MAG: hypothetical protein L0H93_16790, partial [Nocardioides sp.]|nr:hypothetical protein [Nocardioides sp.]
MRPSAALCASLLLLVIAGCGGGEGGASLHDSPHDVRSVAPARDLSSPCDLIPDDTLARVVAAVADQASRSLDPSVGLKGGDEDLLACNLLPVSLPQSLAVGFGEIGPDQSLEEFVAEGESLERLEEVGDEAVLSTSGDDDVRIVVRTGEAMVMVDSDFLDRDLLVELAATTADEVAEQGAPEPIELPDACPPVDDTHIVNEVGQVVLARGSAPDDGPRDCQYAGADRYLHVSIADPDQAGHATEPVEVDGATAWFDEPGQVVRVVDDSCVIEA